MCIFKYQTDPINMCWLRNFQLRHELGLKRCQAVKSNRPRADEVFIEANCSVFSSFQGSFKVLEQSHGDFLPQQIFCPRENKICSLKSTISEDGQESARPQSTQHVSQVIIVHFISHLNPFLSQDTVQENLHDIHAVVEMVALRWELLSTFLITIEEVRSRKKEAIVLCSEHFNS